MAERGWQKALKRVLRSSFTAKLVVFGPAIAIVVFGFAIAGKFVQPAPPDRLTIATGGTDGAYYAYAQRYRTAFERNGIKLEIRTTSGSVQNLSLLESGEVDVAFLQSGIAPENGILYVSNEGSHGAVRIGTPGGRQKPPRGTPTR